jgi:hypothetical protein
MLSGNGHANRAGSVSGHEYDWWMHAISRPYCLIAATCPARMQSWLQNGLFSPRKVGFAAIV